MMYPIKLLGFLTIVLIVGGCASGMPKYLDPEVEYFGVRASEGNVLLLMPDGAVSLHDQEGEVIGFGRKEQVLDYTDTVSILHEFVSGLDSGKSDDYLIHVLVPNDDGGSSAYYYDLDEAGEAYVDQLIGLLNRLPSENPLP